MSATISICIPCHKSERYIRTTIESALAQTVPADEILISDDRSPDKSFEIVKEYADVPRVRIMRPPQRTTLGGHYRFVLEQATSDFICFLSSDDALIPGFVERMQREIGNDQDIGMVAGACLECDSNLTPMRLRGGRLPKGVFLPPEGFHHFKRGNGYTISVSALSRRILLGSPLLPPQADLATDWYWAMILGTRGKLKFVRDPLGYYRIHASNAAYNNEDAWFAAAAEMLVFLRDQLEPHLGGELDALVQRNLVYREERRLGRAVSSKAPNLSTRIKNLAKGLIALRYRALSKPIRQAERGISVTLEQARRHPRSSA
jgi:glycosyltransferase involved in cell wall biosynthesis